MAKKGLSIPVIADYENTGSVVNYSNAQVFENAVEYSVSIETTEDNNLRADNKIKETDKGRFQSGELTLSTADLGAESSKRILGIKEVERSVGLKKVTELVYDDDAKAPFLGFGIIEEHQIDNVDKYRAVALTKIVFNVPEEACTTREEEIEWQVPEITATIYQSDQADENYKHPWKFEAWLDTEEEAKAYLLAVFGSRGE